LETADQEVAGWPDVDDLKVPTLFFRAMAGGSVDQKPLETLMARA
jgi:hypothetical protein